MSQMLPTQHLEDLLPLVRSMDDPDLDLQSLEEIDKYVTNECITAIFEWTSLLKEV